MSESARVPSPQPTIFSPAPEAACSLEFDVRGEGARATLRAFCAELSPGTVVGLGAPLVQALGGRVPGLRAFETLSALTTMPSTQHGLWVLLDAATEGEAFARAEQVVTRLAPAFAVAQERVLFRYGGRDLTGYVDGTANPIGGAARTTAVVQDGPAAGCSFALVQRFVHDRKSFFRLSEAERDRVVGRRHVDNEEMADAPSSAHIKRTEQESFHPTGFLLRRSMPWGTVERHGLQFLAFAADLTRIDAMLHRMIGADDGVSDALLAFTRPETGSYYVCPPLHGSALDLSLAIGKGA